MRSVAPFKAPRHNATSPPPPRKVPPPTVVAPHLQKILFEWNIMAGCNMLWRCNTLGHNRQCVPAAGFRFKLRLFVCLFYRELHPSNERSRLSDTLIGPWFGSPRDQISDEVAGVLWRPTKTNKDGVTCLTSGLSGKHLATIRRIWTVPLWAPSSTNADELLNLLNPPHWPLTTTPLGPVKKPKKK